MYVYSTFYGILFIVGLLVFFSSFFFILNLFLFHSNHVGPACNGQDWEGGGPQRTLWPLVSLFLIVYYNHIRLGVYLIQSLAIAENIRSRFATLSINAKLYNKSSRIGEIKWKLDIIRMRGNEAAAVAAYV